MCMCMCEMYMPETWSCLQKGYSCRPPTLDALKSDIQEPFGAWPLSHSHRAHRSLSRTILVTQRREEKSSHSQPGQHSTLCSLQGKYVGMGHKRPEHLPSFHLVK